MLDLEKLVLEEEEEELAHFSIGWEEGCVLVSLQKHRKKIIERAQLQVAYMIIFGGKIDSDQEQFHRVQVLLVTGGRTLKFDI